MKRSVLWRVNHFIHNVVCHPLLPLAEVLNDTKHKTIAKVLYTLHDITTPSDDRFNKQTYSRK